MMMYILLFIKVKSINFGPRRQGTLTSQFGCCPLIWMFHSRPVNNKINSIHERALRITYQDHISTFQELLNKDNSISIHHRNLQVLATEMF